MLDLTILSYVVDPIIDLGVRIGGTVDPFLADIFGSGHISVFAPFVGVFLPGLNTGVHSYGGEHRM